MMLAIEEVVGHEVPAEVFVYERKQCSTLNCSLMASAVVFIMKRADLAMPERAILAIVIVFFEHHAQQADFIS